MNYREVEISKRAAAQIQAGSLWIFANEFKTSMKELGIGEWCVFKSGKEILGTGYVNPHSLISGRLVAKGLVESRQSLFEKQLTRALKFRGALDDLIKSGSYRAVFSESDNLPGLIIDVYGDTVVAQSTTAGMDEARKDWMAAVEAILNPTSFVVRGDSAIRFREGIKDFIEIVKGNEELLRNSHFMEYDLKIAANFIDGQKTGNFLDQKLNRRHLRSHAAGKKVLDLCSYSGAWGLSALKAGADSVTFLDQSEEALKLVDKGLQLNGFDSQKARLIQDDVFDFLESSKEEFDLIVCDPPAFVKSKKNLPQALKAYKKLNRLVMSRLKPGGKVFTCSCSFHLSESDFEALLQEVLADSQKVAAVFYRGVQSPDHPWILNRPESRYLKCLGLHLQ